MFRAPILLLTLVCALDLVGQDAKAPAREKKDPRSFSDRVWFGGGIGLSFGTVTAVQIDPLLGYKVDQEGKFTTGLGFSYWYLEDNRFTPSLSFTGYGYRPFLRYRFIEQLYAHAEFLHMNVERYDPITDGVRRIWVPHLLVGGGYVQSLGGRSSIYIQALVEVLQDPNSIYFGQGAIFGGGIGVGF